MMRCTAAGKLLSSHASTNFASSSSLNKGTTILSELNVLAFLFSPAMLGAVESNHSSALVMSQTSALRYPQYAEATSEYTDF